MESWGLIVFLKALASDIWEKHVEGDTSSQINSACATWWEQPLKAGMLLNLRVGVIVGTDSSTICLPHPYWME